MKYIDAEKLIAEIERLKPRLRKIGGKDVLVTTDSVYKKLNRIIDFAKSLQHSKEAVELEMCAEYWWEERGWIMIPPNTTLKGIESLLEQIKKKLQQEQSEGLHFTPLNRLIQKIPSQSWNDTVNNYAKRLRDCLIKEGYLKDAEVLQGYISYMNGNNVPMATMDEQEQPEVDIEEIINQTYHDGSVADTSDMDHVDYENIARHFYELGRNAK